MLRDTHDLLDALTKFVGPKNKKRLFIASKENHLYIQPSNYLFHH